MRCGSLIYELIKMEPGFILASLLFSPPLFFPLQLRVSITGRVRSSVRPSVPSYFRTTNMAVFEIEKSWIDIMNNGTMSDDEAVTSVSLLTSFRYRGLSIIRCYLCFSIPPFTFTIKASQSLIVISFDQMDETFFTASALFFLPSSLSMFLTFSSFISFTRRF